MVFVATANDLVHVHLHQRSHTSACEHAWAHAWMMHAWAHEWALGVYMSACMGTRWGVIAAEIINEVFRSPNLKICFCFALGCIQNFNFPIHFHLFSLVSIQPHQNGLAKLKSCGHPRAKQKHLLWSEDLKASLRNATAKSIHFWVHGWVCVCLFACILHAFCVHNAFYATMHSPIPCKVHVNQANGL